MARLSRPVRTLLAVSALSLPVFLGACLEQFDRSKANNKMTEERITSEKAHLKLTETGDIPSSAPVVVSIDDRFSTYCSSCHGADGHGDGPAGAALNPHPRNFHDQAWQAKVDDDHIFKVIKNGGASQGLSPVMAPWGGVLTEDEIKLMVGKIRKFGKS